MNFGFSRLVNRVRGVRQARSMATIVGLTLSLLFGSVETIFAQTTATPGLTAPASLPSLAPLAKKVLPAVVNVSATLKPGASDDESNSDQSISPFDELLRRFFEEQGISPQQPPQHEHDIALGSGFIIDPAGYIVTNGHVVANAEKVAVIFNDNTRLPATIIGQDSLTDLAVLKIDAPQALPYVTWGDSDAAEVGDWVLAVGNPFGLGNTLSIGIISARGRDLHAGPYDDFLQIDASINRGNSGGPTFDLNGRVIGINTAIYSPNGGSVGIGFAIPAKLAMPIIDQIREHGKASRGWLGVQIQEITPSIAKGLGLPNTNGALIASVTEGGPAAKAGLKAGDVALSFNGHAIMQLHDLSVIVAATPIGTTADVEIWRDGAKIHISATVAEMPANLRVGQNQSIERPTAPHPQMATVLGLKLAPLTDALRQELNIGAKVRGVIVLNIAPASPFADQDIQVGDVIESVDRTFVASPSDIAQRFTAARSQKRDTLLLLVNRNSSDAFVTLSLSGNDDQVN